MLWGRALCSNQVQDPNKILLPNYLHVPVYIYKRPAIPKQFLTNRDSSYVPSLHHCLSVLYLSRHQQWPLCTQYSRWASLHINTQLLKPDRSQGRYRAETDVVGYWGQQQGRNVEQTTTGSCALKVARSMGLGTCSAPPFTVHSEGIGITEMRATLFVHH